MAESNSRAAGKDIQHGETPQATGLVRFFEDEGGGKWKYLTYGRPAVVDAS